MKTLTIAALSIATLSLSACATYAPHGADDEAIKISKNFKPSDILLAGIPSDKLSLDGVSPRKLGLQDPTCVTFYKNAASFAKIPAAKLPGAPGVPGLGGGGLGVNLLKTIALGTVAGAASGGVGSLGIGSSFLELALSGAANQVVFQGSNAALNTVTSKIASKKAGKLVDGLPAVELSPFQHIESAAEKIGCSAPDAGSLGLDATPPDAGATHTHSAGEHTHTSSDGTTYTHTH